MTRVLLPEPCISRGSIVATDRAVYYQSLNGLIEVAQGGIARNHTEQWITRERWRSLVPVDANTRAIKLHSSYFCYDASATASGFTIDLPGNPPLLPHASPLGTGLVTLTPPNGNPVVNLQSDPWSGTGLVVQNGGVYYYDFADQAPTIMPYLWRSKIYQQFARKNFEAVKVFFSIPAGTPTQGVRNVNDPQLSLAANQYGILRVYADGNLYTTREIVRSGELLRIYSSSKFEDWQFEVEGRVQVNNLQIATSVKELGVV